MYFQEQMLRELEKNSDTEHTSEMLEDAPPVHLHELLASLHKHLLAYCHGNAQDETMVCRENWYVEIKPFYIKKKLICRDKVSM